MKILSFLFFTNFCFSQIIEIKEITSYTKEAIEATNRHRTSLGLKELEEDPILDSACKHHAYYLAYSILYEKNGGGHIETIDIPNFEEKLSTRDRIGHDANEIQAVFITSNEDQTKNIYQLFKSSYGFKSFDEFYIESYKKSPEHYKIIINQEDVLIGSFTLLIKAKTKFRPELRSYLITVTDSRPMIYEISRGIYR